MRNLTVEGRTVFFKTLALSKISKIVFQSLINIIVNHIISEIRSIQKYFIWKNSNPKVRHETPCKESKDSHKNVDIPKKMTSFQCSWVRRLYGNSFYGWKIIPLRLIKNAFGNSFRFHSNLAFKRHHVKSFPYYYRFILVSFEVPSYIFSQNLWYNQYIEIDKEPVHLVEFSDKSINTVSQLYDSNNFFINWDIMERYNQTKYK